MSYVLRIWENRASLPMPASVEEAVRIVDELSGTRPGRNPKFELLAQRLAEGYPGMIKESEPFEDEDEDFILSHLPWRGEQPDGNCEEAVYNLGLTTDLLEKERPFAIEAANVLGLCVLDEQAGEVFLPGGSMLSTRASPPNPSAAPRPDIYRSASSHVLQVWEQPEGVEYPRRIEGVISLVDQLRKTGTGQNPKFVILAQRLLRRFPAANVELASGNVWNGTPPDGRSDCAVYDLDVDAAMVSEVRPLVIRHAQSLGLSVLDELGGEAHFADGFDVSIRSTLLGTRDRFQALSLLAARGNPHAQAMLASLYASGEGVPQDYAAAVKWYRLAAEQGSKEARNDLGLMYKRGQGVATDYAEAARWFRLAAEQGMPEAQTNLAGLVRAGEGMAKDDSEAAKWYSLASKQGNAHATCMLGYFCLNGFGMAKDEKRAVELFRAAIGQGDKQAIFNLGCAYDFGLGVPRNHVAARALYGLAFAGDPSLKGCLNREDLPELDEAESKEARDLEVHLAKQADFLSALDVYVARQPARPAHESELERAVRDMKRGRAAVLFAILVFLFGPFVFLGTRLMFPAMVLGFALGVFGVLKIGSALQLKTLSRLIYIAAMLIPVLNVVAGGYLFKVASDELRSVE